MFRVLTQAAACACGIALLAMPASGADDSAEGVVRLKGASQDASVQPASHSNCQSCEVGYDAGYGACQDCNECRGGRPCPLAGLGRGWNDGYCGRCNGSYCGLDPLGNKIRCLFGNYGGCSHAPGEGYITPSRRPIWDMSMPTSTMWSGQWLCGKGQPHPSTLAPVYMPTDTTQLGYSYSHVPYWMPKAGMVPQLPVPNQFHDRTIMSRCKTCGVTGNTVAGSLPTPAALSGQSGTPSSRSETCPAGQPVDVSDIATGPTLPKN